MGGGLCSGDQYATINEMYGDEIKKYIIKQKGKQFLDREITKLKKEVQETTLRNENQNLKIIQEGETNIKQFYNKTVNELDKRQPGGIKSLEQMTNKKVQEILGYSYIRKLFDQLKDSVTTSLRGEQQQIIQQLTEIKIAQQNQLKQEEFSFIIDGRLTQNQKAVIRSRLQMDYHTEISQYESLLYDQYSQRLLIKNYEHRLQGDVCKQQLSSLVLMGKEKLKIGINLILGQKIDSFIIIE